MAKRQFEIQGSTLRIGGVDLEAGTTGVVIPGVTQATNYRVEEVEDTGDQTRTFSGTTTVIDKVTYDDWANNGDSSGRATYNVDLKGNGKIDEIEVDNEGTYTSAESTTNKNNDMYAYTGSAGDPFSPFVSGDWATIPFRPKMRAKDVETLGGGGGADLGNFDLGDDTVLNTETNNYINFNGQGQGILALGSNEDKDVKISSDGGDTAFTFNSTNGGSLTFPDGTTQTTAYTGGGGGGATSLDNLNDVNISDVEDGNLLRWDADEEKWVNAPLQTASTSILGGVKVDGTSITITNDGVISAAGGGSGGQQYGYLTEFVHSTTQNVDMEAVVMDSDGNSYISHSYYDENQGRRFGGILKLSSTGAVEWNVNLQSANNNSEYIRISSLEYVTVNGSDYLVATGDYYDNNVGKDRGLVYFLNPADGGMGSGLDIETDSNQGVRVFDAVFGNNSGNDFSVLVGESYNETQQKTFTPLAGSGPDKLIVSWTEFNASAVQAGEYIYYNIGGSYGVRMNGFDVVANLDGNPANGGVNIQVSINQNGTYNIVRTNGWSGVIGGWTDPVNVRVLGSYLGGVDSVNDLTFDFSASALNNNSNNVAGWSSNIQGTAISDVVGLGYGGKDWSTEIGNTLTFDYNLNTQAYISRIGTAPWSKSLGTTEYERLVSVVVDSSGNIYASGYYWKNNKGSFVIKYDFSGVEQWAVHIDPDSDTGQTVNSIDILADGNIITVSDEAIVTKINSSDGSIIWQVQGDPNDDISWNADFRGTATPDGNYIFTNYEDSDYKLYVMCVSGTDGSEIWSKRISRFWGGNNGEIYPEDDFDAQYIDCNATSVTIAASTYLYFNNTSTNAGLVINFPISGENTDGQYEQYIIESAVVGWETKSTTSTSVTVNTVSSPVTTSGQTPTTSTNTYTATKTVIGTAGIELGNFEFDGDVITINDSGSEDLTVRAIDDLYLEARGDDIHLRADDDIRFYTSYNFTDDSYSWLYRFNSGGDFTIGDNNNGTYGNIRASLEGSDRVLIFGGEGESWIQSSYNSYTWKFDKNGVTQIPGLIQGNGNVNISIDSNFTASNQLFRFRGGDIASHLHFDTSDRSQFDLYVGDDDQYVKVSKDGTIDIGTENPTSFDNYTWKFDTEGQLNVPGAVIGAYTAPIGTNVTGVRIPDGFGANNGVVYVGSSELENLGDLTGYVITREQDNVTSTVVQMRPELGGNPGFEVADASFFQGGYTYTYTSPGYTAPQPTDLILKAGVNSIKLRTNGDIDANDSVRTFKSVSETVGASVAGTIWNTTLDIQSVKFLVYGLEATTGHSQSCEVLITKDANDDLAISVYAIVYTSTNPLYTLDAAYDNGTGVTRLDASVPGANSVTFHVHATALFFD